MAGSHTVGCHRLKRTLYLLTVSPMVCATEAVEQTTRGLCSPRESRCLAVVVGDDLGLPGHGQFDITLLAELSDAQSSLGSEEFVDVVR